MTELVKTTANLGKQGTVRGLFSGVLMDLLSADPLAGALYHLAGLSAVVRGTSHALQQMLS